MADFSTSSELSVEVDSNSMRAARQEIEDELGDITVSVQGSMAGPGAGPMAGASTDGGRRIGGRGGRGSIETRLLTEQLEVLQDINETLEKTGASGGGGGGGGGGVGLLGGKAGLLLGGGALGGLGLGSFGAGVAQGPFDSPLSGIAGSLEGATGRGGFAGGAGLGINPFLGGLGNLQTAGRLGVGAFEFGKDLGTSFRTGELQRQLQTLQAPDLSLGLLDDVQRFEQDLGGLQAPDLDPKLLDDLTTFDSALQTLSAPDLDPGLTDAVGAFESQLNQLQPPPWFDTLEQGADAAAQTADTVGQQVDRAVPVDLDAAVDLDTRDLRRDLERAVRNELRGFDLEREVRRIVKNEFRP